MARAISGCLRCPRHQLSLATSMLLDFPRTTRYSTVDIHEFQSRCLGPNATTLHEQYAGPWLGEAYAEVGDTQQIFAFREALHLTCLASQTRTGDGVLFLTTTDGQVFDHIVDVHAFCYVRAS